MPIVRRACVQVWAAMLLCVGALPLPAGAGTEPNQDYDFHLSKGLYLYSSRQDKEARRELTEAVRARPGDPTAGYYLGRTLIRLQQYETAEERFRQVLKLYPDDPRARMGVGMALYHQGRYADALANLSTAEARLTDEPLLFYYQGLAAAALRRYKLAGEKFQRAGALDRELAGDPHYQRGVSFYGQGKLEQAAEEFRSAALTAQPPASGQAPAALPATLGSPAKRWDVSAALSLQYDSNVVLQPSGISSPGNAISRKDDFVTVLNGGADYRFVQDDTWTVGAGYGFYQNIHARLSDFDVQDHTPTIYAQRRFGAAQLRAQYLLDYVTVGGDSYLLANTLQSVLTYPESDRTFTQAWVRYQNQDFKEWSLDRGGVNPTRDANNYMVGAIQHWVFSEGRSRIRAGYTFDTNRTGGGDIDRAVPGRPTSADWSYVGHRLSTGIGFQPLPATTFDLAFDYYRQGYDNPNSFSADGTTVRKDNIFLLTGTAVHDLRSWLWIAFQYHYTRDDANIAAFNYVRHVISFTVGGRF
ncbi:tetratricopeptide repeat protein [Nitrospira moscoviensis]|uniref:Uncharacterized protein n=1 Tax=Nitrospira moscoviensis TaxID=42253 RepID=A0A0K2GJ94_NITMO|nr:tetratricopeptide repeat protein [Nitrospira moscoviensis]ALA60707.1 exported protein of unknown function [Nitrospira moscoviensis]